MVGAPLLAGEAALRAGAGLVTIAAAAHVTDRLERRVREIMTLTLPADPAETARTAAEFAAARRVTAVVVGPGLRAEAAPLCRALVPVVRVPVVLDAGGLLAYRGHISALGELARASPGIIATPHTGEYEKLTDSTLPAARNEIKRAVADFAQRSGLIVVLKGHHSLIARPDGTVRENTTGNPGLATAGTGDVLTGIIAGLLAQGVDAAQAAEAGVYLHGLAGDSARTAKTEAGMVASDVIAYLPEAWRSLER